jgi:predicted ATPase
LPQVTTLSLGRLGQRDRLTMVEALAGERRLPPEVAAQIVERADGVPLFVEELTKAVVESGARDGRGDLPIPTTLHASLLSRLDRSAAMLQVAQVAAALGREFSYRMIRAVSTQPDAVLEAALASLERAELVFCRGRPPEARYSFKHALIQDAAHGTLVRASRRALHARIAEVLAAAPPDGEPVDPAVLAHHYAEAELFAQAVAQHRRAGALLLQRAGTTESLQQLLKARDLLAHVEEGPARTDVEIDLQLALGAAFRGAKGTAAPETGEAYARARHLCEAAGDQRRTVLALHGLGLVYFNRSQLDEAFEVATAMLKLGGAMADAGAGRAGHQALGLVHFASGRFQQARFHLSAPYELMSEAPEDLTQPAADLTGLIYLAWTCFALGYPEEAMRHGARSLDLARPGAQRFRYAVILCNACCIDQFAGRPAEAREMAEGLLAIARERGYVIYGGIALFVRGWARARTGEVEAGLAEMREGIAAYRSDGRALDVPYCLVVLAETLLAAGRVGEARSLIAEALDLIERNGERWFEAEARRVAGDIARADDAVEAERCHEAALAVARRQGARMWELRAATALARLWRDEGRHAEARALLAPVRAWFTEGFGLPDLMAASALLEELG